MIEGQERVESGLSLYHVFLILFHLSQAIEAEQVSWGFCENCLSVFCEFFHGMMAALSQWGPLCFLHKYMDVRIRAMQEKLPRGARRSDGLFWVLFWAVAKKCLACGAITAMPNKKVNVIKK